MGHALHSHLNISEVRLHVNERTPRLSAHEAVQRMRERWWGVRGFVAVEVRRVLLSSK